MDVLQYLSMQATYKYATMCLSHLPFLSYSPIQEPETYDKPILVQRYPV